MAVARCPFDPVFFFDADAYPVSAIDPVLADTDEHGEVFWRDVSGGGTALNWEAVGVPEGPAPVPPLNGGQWAVSKRLRAAELSLYCRLNERGDVLYRHMLGDQDCQRLAWHLLGRVPHLGTPHPPDACGPVWLFGYPHRRPLVVHRIGSKMGPPGAFPVNGFAGPVRGAPLEREAVRFFREAVDRIGVPVGR